MKNQWTVWGIAATLALLLSAAVTVYPQLPGDAAVSGFLQSAAPGNKSWAEAITTSAKTPWSFLLLAITILLSWLIAGWRAAVFAAVCFLGLWLVGPWLQTLIARPRPSPASMGMMGGMMGGGMKGSSPGYSFPSIFALVYATTVGYLAVLAWRTLTGWMRWAVILTCALLMLVGGTARIVLAAHWPSDIVTTYMVGLVWAGLLVLLLQAKRSGASAH
jgi:membrane-associated phospholipid phosphatase